MYKDVTAQVTAHNRYAAMVPGQTIVEIPLYTLECGETLAHFPVAFKTWGRLNLKRDNVLLICHAFTGSADVQDWWGPLLGTDKTFDPSRFFIVCINFLGLPYGSCSPLLVDKATGEVYGPNFPLVTVKDDVGVQRLILDMLGVRRIACVIGGSMGGMAALEYLLTYRNSGYVRSVIALATAGRALAWCISWNETQRQCIFADPNYMDGWYYRLGRLPDAGLLAARMAALLTYRSRNSFETRFGRKLPEQTAEKRLPKNKDEENWLVHNEGLRALAGSAAKSAPQTYFTAQLYLRYQGEKFIKRFDANCYISISRKLDTHDITRGQVAESSSDPLPEYLAQMTLPHLIIGISSDGLFTYGEQQLLGERLPDARLHRLELPEGHDAFLLEFDIIDSHCRLFLQERLPECYAPDAEVYADWALAVTSVDNQGNSVFGEAENITNW